MGVSALELRRRVLMAQPHKERKTGGIVSFSTHVPQVLGVSVPLSPVQAGTGDPYPPGGGINLINIADRTINLNNQYYADNMPLGFSPVAGETYTFSLEVTTTEVPFNVSIGCGKSGYARDIASANGNSSGRVTLTFTPTEAQLEGRPNLFVRAPRYSTPRTVTAEVKNYQLEKGATAHDFAPYSNIRPISGHTGAAVWRTGKNLCFGVLYKAITLVQGGVSVLNSPGTVLLFYCKKGETYTYSGVNNNRNLFAIFDSVPTVGSFTPIAKQNTGLVNKTFIADKDGYGALYVANSEIDTASAQIEPGATATDFAPYSGESFPFTFPATGVNQWDEQWEVGAYNTSTGAKTGTSAGRIRSAGFIPVIPGSNYRVVGNVDGVCYYDKSKNYLSYSVNNSVITIPDDCYFITFYSKTNYGSTYNHDISINYPSTATAYEPYTTTVYGGRLEPAAGRLVVEYAVKSVRDFGRWYEFNSPYPALRTRWLPLNSNKSSLKCSHYKSVVAGSTAPGNIIAGSWYYNLAICDPDNFTTQSELLAYADEQEQAGSQIQIYVPLAEPLIVPLTPAEIRALMGENNVFADTGDVEVEFWTN